MEERKSNGVDLIHNFRHLTYTMLTRIESVECPEIIRLLNLLRYFRYCLIIFMNEFHANAFRVALSLLAN